MEKTARLIQMKIILSLLPLFILVFTCTKISAIPFWFTYLDVVKAVQSIQPFQIYITLKIALIAVTGVLLLGFFHRHNSSQIISKLRTRRIQKLIISSLIICSAIVLMLPFCFLLRVSQAELDNFIMKNKGGELENFQFTLPKFLEQNINSSWNQIEDYFEIDQEIFNSPIDCQIMKVMGITRADIIIYQGWGSCGQTAIVIEEILHQCKYESSRARFIGIDHGWAEVKNDEGKWQIVDPHIGYFKDIGDLGSDTRFTDATGVIVEFRNGTVVDMSKEHGYR